MHSLRHLLVGTDFSPCADAALEVAITLASLGPAVITIVHVCELSPALRPDGSALEDDELIARCSQRLEAVRAQAGDRGVAVSGLVRVGRPSEKINNAAAEVGASLIVLGRAGHSQPGDLGAVTERVLRTASRPVLVVSVKGGV